MKYPSFSFITMFLILGACRQGAEKQEIIQQQFHFPLIIQKPVSGIVQEYNISSLEDISFKCYGKFKFTDTIDFTGVSPRKSMDKKDFLHEYYRPAKQDTLTTDGFQLFIDHNTSILDNRYPGVSPEDAIDSRRYYMPVYVVNETSRTKIFLAKDSYVFSLIEAIDTTSYGEWSPITSGGFDFCGNGYYGLKVHPGEFIMFLIPKFVGNHQGHMRIRLKIGESLYVSSAFPGSFNYSQFYMKKKSWADKEMKKDENSTINELFYGAVPKEYKAQEKALKGAAVFAL